VRSTLTGRSIAALRDAIDLPTLASLGHPSYAAPPHRRGWLLHAPGILNGAALS